MNKLRNLFSLLRSNKTNSENSALKQSENTAGNNLESNENVKVDVTKKSNVFQSNDSVEVSTAKESNALMCNGDTELRLTEETNVLQSNGNKEVNGKEINASESVKIIRILNKVETNACKNMKNVHEAKDANNIKSDETAESDALNKVLNNMNLIVTIVNSKGQNNIENNIKQIQDKTAEPIFPDLAKLLDAINAKVSNTNETTIQNIAHQDRHINAVDTINSNNSPEIQNVNDETTKCLQEFYKILAEVQGNNNSIDVEALTLDDIDEILNLELDMNDDILNTDDILNDEDFDADSTYNFQEIKHNASSIAKKDVIFTGHTLKKLIPGKSSIIATEDALDVISISSDENMTIIENNSTILQATITENANNNKKELNVFNSDVKNEFVPQEHDVSESKELISTEEAKDSKETKKPKATNSKITENTEVTKGSEEIKHEESKNFIKSKRSLTILDTISISSDEHLDAISIKSSEHESDDCGYHSSDFEFITEEEATKDGFIINFVRERHYLNKVHFNNKNQNTIQNNPYGAGPSRKSGNYMNNRTEEKVILDESDQENVMPQEQVNQMVNMFQVLPDIPPGYTQYLENKCAGPARRRRGLGFELRRRETDENEHFRDEALETKNRILRMHPNLNTTRNLRKRRWRD